MNPELTPREELEIKITALLMGQLPPNEAAELEAQIAADPELAKLRAQLARAVELLRASRKMPETPPQLSKERREKLLAAFRSTQIPARPPVPKLEAKHRKKPSLWPVLTGSIAVLCIAVAVIFPASHSMRGRMENERAITESADFVAEDRDGLLAPAPEAEAKPSIKRGLDLAGGTSFQAQLKSDRDVAPENPNISAPSLDVPSTPSPSLPLAQGGGAGGIPGGMKGRLGGSAMDESKRADVGGLATADKSQAADNEAGQAPGVIPHEEAEKPNGYFLTKSSRAPAVTFSAGVESKLKEGGPDWAAAKERGRGEEGRLYKSVDELLLADAPASPAARGVRKVEEKLNVEATGAIASREGRETLNKDGDDTVALKTGEEVIRQDLKKQTVGTAPSGRPSPIAQAGGPAYDGGVQVEGKKAFQDLDAPTDGKIAADASGAHNFKVTGAKGAFQKKSKLESSPEADRPISQTAQQAKGIAAGKPEPAKTEKVPISDPQTIAGIATRSESINSISETLNGRSLATDSKVNDGGVSAGTTLSGKDADYEGFINYGAPLGEVRPNVVNTPVFSTKPGAARNYDSKPFSGTYKLDGGSFPVIDPEPGKDRPEDIEGFNLSAYSGAKRSGTLRLEGENTYTGVTKVGAGTLQLDATPPPVVTAAPAPAAEPPPPPKAPEPAPVPQPEVSTKENAFSTFSLNVSDVSFKLSGASLEKGQMPAPASIRSEEFINAMNYRDPEPAAGAPFAFATERARYPFAHNRDLLRVSLKTAAAGREEGRPLNLVLLVDNSGSMERADRVRILKESMRVLSQQLKPQDKLSIITFSRTARLWADGVTGDKASEVTRRIGEITPEGGTNLSAAMDLGYQTALKHYQANSVNRVVLLTDGAANLGDVKAETLKQKVEAHRKQGVAFDCFGIGWEDYNDDLLEQLSRNGDGRYGFINSPEAATTEFAGQLAGALRVAASDVKVQIEFNPQRVTAYRQVGYAKHQLKKEQFRDNTVDAAELGAAESGNALYVIDVDPKGQGEIGVARARFKVPGTSDYREHEWVIPYQAPAPAIEQSSSSLRLAATAAAFAEWLAQSPYAADVTPDRLLGLMNGIPAIYGADQRPAKLEWMIRQAKSLR